MFRVLSRLIPAKTHRKAAVTVPDFNGGGIEAQSSRVTHVTQLVGGGVGIQSRTGVYAVSITIPGIQSVEAGTCGGSGVGTGKVTHHMEEPPQSPVPEAC